MFYDTVSNAHGLVFNPFKALVAPRPIGWISSLSAEGMANLAPYSFFNAVADTPPIVMFSSSGWKDSVRNIEATGEFVCNIVSYDLRDEMNASSAPVGPDVSEFDLAGLEMAPSNLVKVPRVKRAKAALECRMLQIQQLKDLDGNAVQNYMVLGQVTGVHIDDSVIENGRVVPSRLELLSRLGYKDYDVTRDVFELTRPKG
ncbi:flavin reductase family protein [Pannonibacter indicus]|uniref:NADH-FMN oxidoreductase RutF, flavin reductase (DIM6/NTAB) family n=1 Tax=Pannonibacter indicus TaxID=466044 RepID=A0A0K6IBC1_9HYPH|nr:flavin reductase family protein [Pannonibacter indicus]CUB00414.1 NADH-FMN oxidoreductase RutF, flavin reductase (DIM6/NTAB) family [Pannonibacter indicus]